MQYEDLQERFARPSLPSLRDIAAILFRQRAAIIITFAAIVAAAWLSGIWVPSYEAEMKILVQRQRSDAVISASPDSPAQFGDMQVSEEDLNSEAELLNSEDLLQKVALMTDLNRSAAAGSEREDERRTARAVRELSKALVIEPLHKTNVISVRYKARDPQSAANVLKAVAAAYIQEHIDVSRSSGEATFFDQQARGYEQALTDAQSRLEGFDKETGVVSADLERDSALREASEFSSTARQAQTAAAETERRIRALEAKLSSIAPRATTVVRTSENPELFQQLKSTLLNLELKRTELLTKYEPGYRLVQEVDRQIEDAKDAISAEERKPMRDETSDRNPEYEWARSELDKDEIELEGLKARSAAAESTAARYHEAAHGFDRDGVVQQNLMRAAKTQEENYMLYARKREEARISEALDKRGIMNAAVIEQPIVPAFPNRSSLASVMLTLLLAGTASVSSAFVLDFIAPCFRTPDEVSKQLGMRVLAALPAGSL